MVQTICLLLAAVLFFLAGAGVDSWGVGSVTLNTIGFGLFFFMLACLVGVPRPWRKG